MVFPMDVLKLVTHWVLSFFRIARKVRSYSFLHRTNSQARSQHIHGHCFFEALLKSSSPFPYFMLVAFEGGSPLRALILLLSSPLLFILGYNKELTLRIMAFITFCGLRTKDVHLVSRAVLPKFFLEDMHLHYHQQTPPLMYTRFPRVMVEWFLQEYYHSHSPTEVIAPDLHVIKGSYFSGLFLPELYTTFTIQTNNNNTKKQLVFHDGRLAFFPTPLATLSLFLWLPLAIPLSITRTLIGLLLPYKASIIIGSFTGIRLRIINPTTTTTNNGTLYVCTHRTLLDPVMLSTALARPIPAVTYSLSRMSELIAPLRTIRLTRNRLQDSETMKRLLQDGDLVVCPEGTTCREPYLLRFSALFAELADEIVPVAVDVRVNVFYGTTASGFKWLDPLFLLMNPWPEYSLEFLGEVPPEMTCRKGGWSSAEVANRIQRQLAGALGFECTELTRKDKYLVLAGNEGLVNNI
ncbi:putative glycerol-3-phosphate 1-O-acyltransferase [Dioscorea sansibarensis]